MAFANPICERIARLREEIRGQRGKADFARDLGISPSTYNYYEDDRVPPADVLVRIADRAGVDLRWLLTGQLSSVPVPADHPAVVRIAALLKEYPAAEAPLAAFVDLLAASFGWPAKTSAAAEAPAPVVPTDARRGARQPAAEAARPGPVPPERPPVPASAVHPQADWIPILGRSAAGVPQFWKDAQFPDVTLLSELVERHARKAQREVLAAQAQEPAQPGPSAAQIITLREVAADSVAEFIVAGDLKRRHPDAFAVRIDGDSMSPEIRHGDLVVCSACVQAADGQPALVQMRGQIGVTCKIVRREGHSIHLVPINETYPPQSFPLERLAWARRVLARIRPREAGRP